jgi:hypothetical protein
MLNDINDPHRIFHQFLHANLWIIRWIKTRRPVPSAYLPIICKGLSLLFDAVQSAVCSLDINLKKKPKIIFVKENWNFQRKGLCQTLIGMWDSSEWFKSLHTWGKLYFIFKNMLYVGTINLIEMWDYTEWFWSVHIWGKFYFIFKNILCVGTINFMGMWDSTGWLKSLHTWGKLYLIFKNMLYVGTINFRAHIDASLPLIANSL